MTSVYIYAAKRTPIGSFQGQLSSQQGWQLGASILKAIQADVPLPKFIPTEVMMGCVLSAGQGQAPTRQAVKAAFECGDTINATTINKVCGSGMRSVMYAANHIALNPTDVMFAGGFESMSQAPYLLPKARNGFRMGHGAIYDHMMLDGLEDAYQTTGNGNRMSMGVFADQTASDYGFDREMQEAYAREGYDFYQDALSKGLWKNEIAPVIITDAKGNQTIIENDEQPTRVKVDKFQALRPAFGANGTVTAATSSSIADGAAAIVLGSDHLQEFAKPIARIVGFASHALDPAKFALGPIGAIQKLLSKIDWPINTVDLFEVNEAFAIVPMAVMKDLKVERSRMNVQSGACTIGHPIGASGARVIATLVNILNNRNLKRGVASVCIGGGEGVAIAVEML